MHVIDWLLPDSDLVRDDPLQTELTERVRDRFRSVENLYRIVREDCDRDFHMRKARGELNAREECHVDQYPVGCCDVIMGHVFHRVDRILRSSPDLLPEGMIHKVVYGVFEDRCFQNAIQYGDYFVNIAANSVDGMVPERVSVVRSADAPFENLDGYERYADLLWEYWRSRITPNVFFPEIAPMFPFIVVDAEGQSRFDSNHAQIMRKEFLEGFPRARRLLSKAPKLSPTPANRFVLEVFRSISKRYSDIPFLRVSDNPADALAVLDAVAAISDPEELEARFHEMGSAAMFLLNSELRQLQGRKEAAAV